MPVEDKYTITPDMIPKDFIDDWLNDSVSDNWPEFIARRLNAAIRFSLVASKMQFDDAVEQDYCTICGKALDEYKPIEKAEVVAKNVRLNYMERGTEDVSYHESVMSAAIAAYWAIEDNTFMPVSIEENGVVIWENRGDNAQFELWAIGFIAITAKFNGGISSRNE